MKFANIYKDSKDAVAYNLKTLWCSNIKDENQAAYANKISRVIDNLFATEDNIPVVQCMDFYESIEATEADAANQLIDGLWDKPYPPYKHQYKCWEALNAKTTDGKCKSIVVTTGTGSGKTECFMLPLVADLKRKHKLEPIKSNQIEAIFLYPLNALMEDQKMRLSKLLEGTGLTFAVYNSSLPEREEINEENIGLPGEITNRQDMRSTPPNILLTNPTMLEYMLLRQNDQRLFTRGSLQWIVLDETHTYTGAGATELAMLLRRVIDAFGVSTDNIRFATSSATIGSQNDDKELKLQNTMKLRQFIASLCGQTVEQIEHIGGKRVSKGLEDSPLYIQKELLIKEEFVRLDKLVPGDSYTIEERLNILDDWCDADKYGNGALRAKVHFFFRVPDNGLYVRLTEHQDGVFEIYDKQPLQEEIKDNAPYLELVRCSSCGGFFTIAQVSDNNTYRIPERDVTDMFYVEEESEYMDDEYDVNNDDAELTNVIFALTNAREVGNGKKDGTGFVIIEKNKVKTARKRPEREWTIIRNLHSKCPHCGESLLSNSSQKDKKNYEEDSEDFENLEKFNTFRVSSDFISRVISEPIMTQLCEHGDQFPHKGQQYISFVDSRQAAAKSTLGQNLEEEMLWCYSRIYHTLCKQKNEQNDVLKKRQTYFSLGLCEEEVNKLAPLKDYYTWTELLNILREDKSTSEMLCLQFLNRNKGSEEINEDGTIKQISLNRYLCSLMLEKLSRHPRYAVSPETMGLFTTCYPKLDRIEQLPDAVKKFNSHLMEGNRLCLQDWKDLLQIFLDFRVRSDGSITMKINDDRFLEFDIFMCERFQTEKQGRRPAQKPQIDTKNGKYSNVVRLLAALYNEENNTESIKLHKDELASVIDALWKDLTDTTGLLIDEHQTQRHTDNYSPSFRLNVADIAFKLYDKCCMCDARRKQTVGMIPRPIALTFKGYSPYIIGEKVNKPLTDVEDWSTPDKIFPYYKGADSRCEKEKLDQWKNEKRKLFCTDINGLNNKIWGEDGVFSKRLDAIHLYPDIYIQAEHTAQIDKVIARKSQEMFKEYEINILACSTTMEMGVDLGSLEFVLMSSVPPHPSNYKQRAGRSGRNDFTRSACATLCKSDSLGLRTLQEPLEQLINRVIAVPTVDINSKKVILRHVNSYLLRDFIFNYPIKSRHNNLELEIIDFFTNFEFLTKEQIKGKNTDYYNITHKDDDSRRILPKDGIGSEEDESKTYCRKFIQYLNGSVIKENGIKLCFNFEGLKRILSGITCVTLEESVANTITQIKTCYDELKERIVYIAQKYEDAEQQGNKNYQRKWEIEYHGLFAKNLIEHLSTNRFTPNANMPVDVVAFRQNGMNNSVRRSINSDPSYQLVQALRMYSPGNTIVISNRTRIVRGIKYSEDRPIPYKELYFDKEKATMLREPENAWVWSVNNQKALKVIQPLAFLPDENEMEKRMDAKNPYSQVEAQLIDPENWDEDADTTTHLYSIRRSQDKGSSKILYYNKGKGYGYCICRNCGKTVMEAYAEKLYRINLAPAGMNDRRKGNSETRFHNKLNKYKGKAVLCSTDENQDDMFFRNVILGAEIQTDYCEIRLRHSQDEQWIRSRNERSLLNTLGIVFTNKLIEYLDKERNSIDFLITPNHHLCIYDTNSGGSGYSIELYKPEVMKHILNETYKLLKSCKSKDEILDRFTYQYLNKIDIQSALNWLEAELSVKNE